METYPHGSGEYDPAQDPTANGIVAEVERLIGNRDAAPDQPDQEEVHAAISELQAVAEIYRGVSHGAAFESATYSHARYGTAALTVVVAKSSLQYPDAGLEVTQHTIRQTSGGSFRSTHILSFNDEVGIVSAYKGTSSDPPLQQLQPAETVEPTDLLRLHIILAFLG